MVHYIYRFYLKYFLEHLKCPLLLSQLTVCCTVFTMLKQSSLIVIVLCYFMLKDSSLKYCVHGLKAIDSDCHFFCYAILFIINTMYKS